MKTYAEKLKDPRWQKLRLKVMERDGFRCVACGVKDKTLHVHHMKYSGDPHNAPPVDLITLCMDCHGIAEDCVALARRLPSKLGLPQAHSMLRCFVDGCTITEFSEAVGKIIRSFGDSFYQAGATEEREKPNEPLR